MDSLGRLYPLAVREQVSKLHQRTQCQSYKCFQRLPYRSYKQQGDKSHNIRFFCRPHGRQQWEQHRECHLTHWYNLFSIWPIPRTSWSKCRQSLDPWSWVPLCQIWWHLARTSQWIRNPTIICAPIVWRLCWILPTFFLDTLFFSQVSSGW